MKKGKLLIGFLSLVFVFFLATGCDSAKDNNKTNNTNKKTEEKKKVKTKCTIVECIEKIEPENTVEEVNKIIGIDGVLTDEEHNFYEYDFGNDEKIALKYYSSTKATIVADIDDDKLANKKVDLSKLTDLKAMVNSGITYDQFKAQIGNTDGTLIEKSDTSKRYIWVSTKGGTVRASFRNKDNMCTFFSGFGDRK